MLSIYIHIPFCKAKCGYCDFNSFAPKADEIIQYKNALIEEISQSPYKGEPCDTLFIGGGTPSYISPIYIEEILKAANNAFPFKADCEITVEANPDSITPDGLKIYKNAGVNRISMGVQAFNNSNLRLLGRVHTAERAIRAFEEIRLAGFKNINIDLMFFYPYQTLEDWEQTLNTAVSLAPEHISAYSLILEEGTPFYKKYINYQTNEELYRIMYQRVQEILKTANLFPYEISNYAKEGFACRHNITYWKRYNYLGFGLSAHSMYDNVRFSNTSSLNKYLKGSRRENEEALSKQDQIGEFMFLGMRMTQGVKGTEFKKQFGMDMFEYFKVPMEKYLKLGLLKIKGDNLSLTLEGIHVSNTIFADFI